MVVRQEIRVHQERRLAPRYPVTLEITFDGGTGRTVNLSSMGVYFETECPLELGSELSIVLPFEYAAPGGTRVACAARVVRRDRRADGYGIAATYEAVAFDVPYVSVH